MRFIIPKPKENILNFMRSLSYHFEGKKNGEMAFAKSLGGGAYPKFHIYIQELPDGFEINLHLDQKGASYRGTAMHSGEYGGELVEKEMERIRLATRV